MAHYAIIDNNNIVVNVFPGKDEDEAPGNWETFYSNETGLKVKRTSYNTTANTHKEDGTPFRKNYAGVGYTWDELADAFIPPKPFASWILDGKTFTWEAPISMPTDDKKYYWQEKDTKWVEVPTKSE
jgi:hypothetical protein